MTNILFVCTANLCRSPLAQALTARSPVAPGPAGPSAAGPSAERTGAVRARSAGTAAIPGTAVHPWTAEVLAQRGLTLPAFASRQLGADDLTWADLVLTATREHRSACVRLMPSALRRCFTLKELSRLTLVMREHDLLSEPSAAAVVRAAPVARSYCQPVPAAADDLADPVLLGPSAFAACADEIADLLEPILSSIAGHAARR